SQPRSNRMTSDRAIVESAWYQLRQDDIGLRLTTSIDEHWSSTALDKAGLLAFLERIYQFLAGTSKTAPAPFQQSIDATNIQVKPAFVFEVQVNLTISRSIDRVLEDLKSGSAIRPEYQSVLTSPARLSPKFETTAEAGGLTIRPFAQRFQSAF